MQEADSIAKHLLLFSKPEIVLLGLDFFQFDGLKRTEAGFESGLGNYASAIEKYLACLASDKESQYLGWKERLRVIATEHGLSLLEIDRLHDFSNSKFDGVSGFNDPLHFADRIGTMIMRGVGLPVRASAAPADGKRS